MVRVWLDNVRLLVSCACAFRPCSLNALFIGVSVVLESSGPLVYSQCVYWDCSLILYKFTIELVEPKSSDICESKSLFIRMELTWVTSVVL